MKRNQRSARRPASRRGLTLVELVLAAGLLAILLAAVFKLLDQFMSVWEKAELRRMEVEQSSGVSELLARDLDALEPGPRGDFLAEWVFFDANADGVSESKWPRVRMVRHASDAELARMQAGSKDKLLGEGLIEVVWAVTPTHPGSRNRDELSHGMLWRGERVYGVARGVDVPMFSEKYFSATGLPRPGSANVVSDDVLWLGVQFALPTSDLRNGWKLGQGPEDVAPSWDAWASKRANVERHVWNDTSAYLPKPAQTPILPRRARLEIELESPSDFKRRTRTTRFVSPQDTTFEVDNGDKLPAPGSFVLIDWEWMQISDVSGDTVSVRRGQRGCKASPHEPGGLVHYGRTLVREVPIAQHREEWDL